MQYSWVLCLLSWNHQIKTLSSMTIARSQSQTSIKPFQTYDHNMLHYWIYGCSTFYKGQHLSFRQITNNSGWSRPKANRWNSQDHKIQGCLLCPLKWHWRLCNDIWLCKVLPTWGSRKDSLHLILIASSPHSFYEILKFISQIYIMTCAHVNKV